MPSRYQDEESTDSTKEGFTPLKRDLRLLNRYIHNERTHEGQGKEIRKTKWTKKRWGIVEKPERADKEKKDRLLRRPLPDECALRAIKPMKHRYKTGAVYKCVTYRVTGYKRD